MAEQPARKTASPFAGLDTSLLRSTRPAPRSSGARGTVCAGRLCRSSPPYSATKRQTIVEPTGQPSCQP